MPPTIGDFSFDMDEKNKIGQGGYANVYKCTSKSQPSKSLCIKIYDVDPTNYQLQKQLSQESGVIKRLENASHQNLIKIYGKGYFNNSMKYYIVMDLCSQDLVNYCKKRDHLKNPFNENEIFSFIKQIANGYKPFLTRNIIHRDIKPQNILVNIVSSNNVDILYYKITDFDCSKILCNNILQTWNKGTWQYCAPESDYSNIPQTQQADVFSFGCTLYYFVYGKNFKIQNPEYQGGRRLYSDYEENNFSKLNRLSPKSEAFIIDLLQKCLLKDKDKRITWLEIIQLKQIQDYEMIYNALDSLLLENTLQGIEVVKPQIKDRTKRINMFFRLLRYKINILDHTIKLIMSFHSCHINEILIIRLTYLILHYYNFQLGLISGDQKHFPRFIIKNKKYYFPKEDIIQYTTELMEKKNLHLGKEALEARIFELQVKIKQFQDQNTTMIADLEASLSEMEDIILRNQLQAQLEKCEKEDDDIIQNIDQFNNCYFQKVLNNQEVLNKNSEQKNIQKQIIINISQIIEFETKYDQSKYNEIQIPSQTEQIY